VATLATGAPVLAQALAALDCRTEAIHEGGDHLILVGRVIRIVASEEAGGAPLVYHRGRYSRLAEGAGGG
jgi:flavin reductase (DIM6/NTAB) family NADH-FMN oxidoreductase RutF